jgi:hypothetical protein
MDKAKVKDLIDEFEAEVNNGGFDQYFYNSAGDGTAETIQALEAIGALHMADILRRAAAMFPGGMPPKERFDRQHVLLELFREAEAFEVLDNEFYAYPDDLGALLKKFVAS